MSPIFDPWRSRLPLRADCAATTSSQRRPRRGRAWGARRGSRRAPVAQWARRSRVQAELSDRPDSLGTVHDGGLLRPVCFVLPVFLVGWPLPGVPLPEVPLPRVPLPPLSPDELAVVTVKVVVALPASPTPSAWLARTV